MVGEKIDDFNIEKRIKKVSSNLNETIYHEYLKNVESKFHKNYRRLL